MVDQEACLPELSSQVAPWAPGLIGVVVAVGVAITSPASLKVTIVFSVQAQSNLENMAHL